MCKGDQYRPQRHPVEDKVVTAFCGTNKNRRRGACFAVSYLSCYPGCFREPHWKSMGHPEISRVTCSVLHILAPVISIHFCAWYYIRFDFPNSFSWIKLFVCIPISIKIVQSSNPQWFIIGLAITAWCWIGYKSLSKPLFTKFNDAHMCVTRRQWFNVLATVRHKWGMMTSSNGDIFRVTGPCAGNSPVTSKFPSQRTVTRSFDVFFDLGLNKWLSKQSKRWWFETPLCSLWRHRNGDWRSLINLNGPLALFN